MSDGKTWICTVSEAAQAVSGQILSDVQKDFSKVGTDSRANLDGRLFIPLKGDNFDGITLS